VARVRCLRGFETLSAATVQAEVCDFRRFATASAFMAFTDLVPCEHSSGDRQHRGSITKSGNRHLRRVFVEAAWSYRHRPDVSPRLRARVQGQGADVLAFCWKAQVRLHDADHSPSDCEASRFSRGGWSRIR
jgi:transposase